MDHRAEYVDCIVPGGNYRVVVHEWSIVSSALPGMSPIQKYRVLSWGENSSYGNRPYVRSPHFAP